MPSPLINFFLTIIVILIAIYYSHLIFTMPCETRSQKKARIAGRFHPAQRPAPPSKRTNKTEFVQRISTVQGWGDIQNWLNARSLPAVLQRLHNKSMEREFWKGEQRNWWATQAEEGAGTPWFQDRDNFFRGVEKELTREIDELWKRANELGLQGVMKGEEVVEVRDDSPETGSRTPTPEREIIDLSGTPAPTLSSRGPTPGPSRLVRPEPPVPGPSRTMRSGADPRWAAMLRGRTATPPGLDRYGQAGAYGQVLDEEEGEWQPYWPPN